MKEFDLEKAKSGDPVQTRDGRPVRILCFDFKDPEYTMAGAALKDGEEIAVTWSARGFYHLDEVEHVLDLVMAPKKLTLWHNYYLGSNGDIKTTHYTYKTENDAISARSVEYEYLGAYSVEIEL
jgi:hypothetical protein